MAKIRSSDYLSHCYEHLCNDISDMVIFGQSLQRFSDQHILDALLKHKDRTFAIAIHAAGKEEDEILAEKREFLAKFGAVDEQRVMFFDSSTHPLGYPGQDSPFRAFFPEDDQ